ASPATTAFVYYTATGPPYCASVTCSIHCTATPLSASCMAMCTMALVGLAPCQCFSPGGIHTTSPGRISRIGPPQVCTRRSPDMRSRVWPSGWVCHAVRAPGSKLTRPARMRAGSGASMIGSCHTVPVNQSPGMRRDGADPDSLMSMTSPCVKLRLRQKQRRASRAQRRRDPPLRTLHPFSIHDRPVHQGVDHLAIMPADRARRLRHEDHDEVFPRIGPPVGAAGARP